ncbi:MAG: hypothetical protein ACYTFE_00875 [Planctomycetota bacterium]|jgi:hypothetical protein
MKIKISFINFIMSIADIAATAFAVSQSERMQLKTFGVSTLDGLESVKPLVTFAFRNYTGQPRKLALLNEETIKTQVEEQLKKEKITIAEEPAQNTGILVVSVVGINTQKDQSLYIFTIQIELIQNVKLIRDEEILTSGRTWPNWTNTKLITVGPSQLKTAVTQSIKQELRTFIEDFKAANSR